LTHKSVGKWHERISLQREREGRRELGWVIHDPRGGWNAPRGLRGTLTLSEQKNNTAPQITTQNTLRAFGEIVDGGGTQIVFKGNNKNGRDADNNWGLVKNMVRTLVKSVNRPLF